MHSWSFITHYCNSVLNIPQNTKIRKIRLFSWEAFISSQEALVSSAENDKSFYLQMCQNIFYNSKQINLERLNAHSSWYF